MQANNAHAEALEFIENKRETLPHLETELKTWEKKAKAFASIDDLKTKVSGLKNELVWTLVAQVSLEKSRSFLSIFCIRQ